MRKNRDNVGLTITVFLQVVIQDYWFVILLWYEKSLFSSL